MRIGILTSSRADYGIYTPLLKALRADPYFKLNLIVFGTHLSQLYGYTIKDILLDKMPVFAKLKTVTPGDTAKDISKNIAYTINKFSGFWSKYAADFDCVVALGDRYEMFAAVSSGVIFNIKFIHLHGGETTLGSIDNYFRNCISHASFAHFTAHQKYTQRLTQLLNSKKNVFTTGALSLDNLTDITLYSLEELNSIFNVSIGKNTALITIHPETVDVSHNIPNLQKVINALTITKTNAVICLPNNDTSGKSMREFILKACKKNKNFYPVEHFGTKGYFSAMHHCRFMLGNTSSGIIEGASLGANVINLGNRQKGRVYGQNVISIPFEEKLIIQAIKKIRRQKKYTKRNIYWKGGAATLIIHKLKKLTFDKEY